VDAKGLVLADRAKKIIGKTLALPEKAALFTTKKITSSPDYG
jgi:hypothetical protein